MSACEKKSALQIFKSPRAETFAEKVIFPKYKYVFTISFLELELFKICYYCMSTDFVSFFGRSKHFPRESGRHDQ